jgi:hypothetical protein
MREERNRQHQLAAGLIIMAIGTVFLLDRLDVISFRESFRQFWPLILIVIGVSKIVEGGRVRRIGDGR